MRGATAATYVAFIGSGFAFASWAARIPQVRDRLDLDPAVLGMVLLATAVGSLLALPLSGPVVTRIGSRRTVVSMAMLLGVALTVVAVGFLTGVATVVVGLFLLGFANGAWDVAMNVQGAVVERHLGRSIMPRFHAGFSVGTVGGALVGAGMVALRVSVAAHLVAVALVVAVVVAWFTRGFLPDHEQSASEAGVSDAGASDAPVSDAGASDAPVSDAGASDAPVSDAGASDAPRGGALTAWREPRTLLIGLFVMSFAFAEGVGNDWISVAAIDGHHVRAETGTLAFACFLAAMTTGRWFGPGLLDRYGRVPVVRTLAVVGVAGLVLFVFGPSLIVAFVGTLLWGLGASLGFPVGMSAGSDDPRRAAARVSVIASIGYCAFLAGPPAIGFLGQETSVLRALVLVAVLLGVAFAIASTVRPLDAGGSPHSGG